MKSGQIFKFLLLLAVFFGFFFLVRKYKLEWRNEQFSFSERDIDLPKQDYIAGYIQKEPLDFDGDGNKEEVAAIYNDAGTEDKLYNAFFVIFKKKGDDWEKLFERHLNAFNLWDERSGPSESGKKVNQIQIGDLTTDGVEDILVTARSEDIGSFLKVYVYSWRNDQVEVIFQSEGLYQGKSAIEKDKVWTLMGVLEAGDDYFPSYWVKQWWQWQVSDFVTAAYWEGDNFEESETIDYEEAVSQSLKELTDEEAKELAIEFLAGERVKVSKAVKSPSEKETIDSQPQAFSVEETTMIYDSSINEYKSNLIKITGGEERKIKKVILEYNQVPHKVEVQIDVKGKRVVSWVIGKR